MWWNEASNRRVVHRPRIRVGQGLGHGFGFYQIELQHLAGFYLRTTIRERESRAKEGARKCNGQDEDGVDHYRVGWVVRRNINWTCYRQLELARALARVDNKICFSKLCWVVA